MKKIKKLALGAMIMGLGSMVFANPESNTKKATQGLLADGVVDSLDTGIEDGKGFGSISLGSESGSYQDFNITFGSWKDNIWRGFNYTNSNSGSETWTQDAEKDYKKVGNEVTAIDTTKTLTDISNLGLYNRLSYNHFNKETNKGYELFFCTDLSQSKDSVKTTTDKESDSTSSVELGSKNYGTSAYNHFSYWNSLYVRFNNYKTEEKGDKASYFALNGFGVWGNGSATTTKDKDTSKVYNSTLGAGRQTVKNNNTNINRSGDVYWFEGEYGYKLKDFGLLSTDFKLINLFEGVYTGTTDVTSQKYVTKENDFETTETVSKNLNSADFRLSNKVTPRYDFDIKVGDNVKVAARIDAPTTISYTRNGIDYYTTKSTTVIKDLEHGTQTKYVSNEQSMASDASTLNENEYGLSVSPEAKVGIVWAVKPGKFNINLGATANAGTYSCAVTTKTASKKLLKNKEVYTDEFGVKTVKTDNKTPVNPTAVEESVETKFTASKVTVKGSFGPTIFINDKVSLDMLLSANTETGFGIGTLLNSYANISINVKF